MNSESTSGLLSKLDQALHNSGIGKNERQAEIVKLLLCRVYAAKNGLTTNFVSSDEISGFVSEVLEKVKLELPQLKISHLKLDSVTLISVWKILSNLDPSRTDQSWVQDIFMKFGPQFLKKDLDQFFTPIEIVEFMCDVLNMNSKSVVIDPAGGSADFLTGASKSVRAMTGGPKGPALHYWDQSAEASEVAALNLWLGNTNASMKIQDSIAESTDLESKVDFCITNPPFGTKTIWAEPRPMEPLKNYDLACRWNSSGQSKELFRQQLGILFIERGLKLLKPGGVLAIVLPSGYLSNPSEWYLRKWLLENYRVLGVVSLPAGTFKKSGAGVSPDILFVEKTQVAADYEIFMSQAKTIGFDYKKQDVPVIYKRNLHDGSIVLDDNGIPVKDNDLEVISREFSKFARENNVSTIRQLTGSEAEYVSVKRSEVLDNPDLTLSPKQFSKEYLSVISTLKKKGSTLKELGATVSNSDGLKINVENMYTYLDIGEIGTGTYRLENQLMGWQLPSRAKQRVSENDILVSRLAGSVNKFCLIGTSQKNLVATNGLFKVTFDDEKSRMLFFNFLFTKEYRIQVEALATGSIMEDIKEQDFLERLLIPTDVPDEKLQNLRDFVHLQSKIQLLT